MGAEPKRSWWWWTRQILCVIFILFVIALFIPMYSTGGSGDKARAYSLANQIHIACMLYNTEYGRYPPTTDNAKLYVLLNGGSVDGENPRHIQFMTFDKKQVNAKGEIIDPWKTPYRITFDKEGPWVVSACKDKRFDTPDDISSRQ